MVKWVRDFNDLSPRKKIVVNLSSIILGALLIIGIDQSMGLPLGRSIFNIGVILLVGMAAVYVYGRYQKRLNLTPN